MERSLEPSEAGVMVGTENSHVPSVLISPSRWQMIELCVHAARSLGIPRSICEIFGFVFTAAGPVTFEDVVAGLGMSNGSASHGLRYLRRIGALSVTYMARDRRDYYVAEISLGKLVTGYLMENITHHLADNRERISSMRNTLRSNADACNAHHTGNAHLYSRAEILLEWNRQFSAALMAASEALLQRSGSEP